MTNCHYPEYIMLVVLAVCWTTLNAGAVGAVQNIGAFGDGALEDDGCVQRHCGYAVDKTELADCMSVHCSKPVKRWIDTTHYSEGRRSVLDSLERCIRLVCHGKGGMSLKECAFACSEKRKRSGSESTRGVSKKWVDPLNYGMGDEKRSSSKRSYDGDVFEEKPSVISTIEKVCDQLCGSTLDQMQRPFVCELGCQQTLVEIRRKWRSM